MRRCEYKRRYCSEEGRFINQHIYGEGVFDSLKKLGQRVLGKTAKKAANKRLQALAEKAVSPAGGDKIVQLLRKTPAAATGAKGPQAPTAEEHLMRLLAD